jgi:hypothetical protein
MYDFEKKDKGKAMAFGAPQKSGKIVGKLMRGTCK